MSREKLIEIAKGIRNDYLSMKETWMETDQSREDYYGLTNEEFRKITAAVRRADVAFEREGGGTRHWVRDHFFPELDAAGFKVVAK